MRVFHILEEISKRNNSIVSVSKIFLKYSKLRKSKIIIPKEQSSKILNKIKQFNIYRNFFFLNSEIYKFMKKNKPDVIHIHGLWRPIHILFILKSKLLNTPIILQPHGMLLDEAVKGKSIYNYILKLLAILIYRLIIKNIFFIAVTEDEKKSIIKYFGKKRIYIISNPLEANLIFAQRTNTHISYFGRISRHKNLHLIIRSFIHANLNKKWKLILYGIEDDIEYRSELEKIILKYKFQSRIIFKKPIFSKNKKFKTMSKNFLNILMSKSEILSLSVLESLSVGTKSLVNKNIKYPKEISKLLYFSNTEISSISDKLKIITNSQNTSIKNKKKLINSFKKYYDLPKTKEKYYMLLDKITSFNKNKKNYVNIFNIGIANGLNSFIVPYLIVLFGFIKPNIAAEVGIVEGTLLFVTQIFSSNSRAIILTSNKENNYFNFIFFRILVSSSIFILYLIIFENIDFIEKKFHFWLILVVLIAWINEINLIFSEKENLKFLTNLFIIFNILFYIILLPINIYSEFELINIFKAFFIFHLLFYLYFISIDKIFSFREFNFIYKNFFSFLSTFTNTSAVIIWRYSILILTSKEVAGMFFAIFSIASFPGTFFNNILGQSILRDKKLNYYLKLYEKKIYLLATIIISSLLLYLKIFNKNILDQLIVNTLFISLYGTVIMIIALRYRHAALYRYSMNQNIIFKRDIILGILISPIIFIVYYFNNIEGISIAYLCSAITSNIVYTRKYD